MPSRIPALWEMLVQKNEEAKELDIYPSSTITNPQFHLAEDLSLSLSLSFSMYKNKVCRVILLFSIKQIKACCMHHVTVLQGR